MFIEFLTSRFFFLLFWTMGVVALVAFVRFANWTIKIKWRRDAWPIIQKDPRAVSDYFGKRFIGICLFVGLLAIAGAIV